MGTPARCPGSPLRSAAPSGFARILLLLPLLLSCLIPGPARGQDAAPRPENADLPRGGQIRLGAFPIFQSWFQEFGVGGEGTLPLARDLSGPLEEAVFPGPDGVAASVNEDAGALGFAPLASEEVALGTLDVRELNIDRRTVAVELEIGLLDRIALDVMVPLVRTEVEPFFAFDSAGATLAGAADALPGAAGLLGEISDARSALQARLDAGELSGTEAEQARELLDTSGAFASALQDRVDANGLIPLGGTRAGSEILSRYGALQSGFQSFDLSIPDLALPGTPPAGLLDGFFDRTLAGTPPGPTIRSWRAGETEIGLRIGVIRGFTPDPSGLQLRTTVGARTRVPLRDPNVAEFVNPSDLLGVPLGDGQQDVEFSLYQDVRVGPRFSLASTFRYGVQLADRPTVRIRSPDRPLSFPDQIVPVERDLGDYLRVRAAPRYQLIPAVALGVEYRYWHKAADEFRRRDGGDRIAALEAETEETRHRLGLGVTFRPDPPDGGEAPGGTPELGFVHQVAVSGSGGETPAAGLTSFYVRVPVQLF